MSLNKVMLIGRLGRDPEMRYTQSGTAVANFSLATDDNWRDKQGNKQERTEWHNIVAWGKLADTVNNYLKKGRQVYVEGRLQTRDWTDNANVKHYRTEIVASTVTFLGGPGERQGGGAPAGNYGGPQGAPGGSQGGPPQGQGGPPPQDDSYDQGGYMEDDIPF